MKLEEIKFTETCLGHECLKATFSLPHPATKVNPKETRHIPIFVEVVKTGVEDTELRVRFDRFEAGLLDALLALNDHMLKAVINEGRFAGYVPLIQTPYESQLIYDYRHDEAHAPNNEESQTEEENENEEEQIRVAD